jgi:hypothetical protein
VSIIFNKKQIVSREIMAKEHILVVEDDEDILELLRYNLTQAGYRVTGMTSGEEALYSIKKQTFDLILRLNSFRDRWFRNMPPIKAGYQNPANPPNYCHRQSRGAGHRYRTGVGSR